MDFEQLRTFLNLAALKSFSKTADHMFVSQPSVSGRIKALEDELGAMLFDRSRPREIILTEQGRVFADYAQRLVNLQEEARGVMAGEDRSPVGILRVGASTVPGTYLAPEILGRFHRICPGVTLNLTILDTVEVLDRIREYGFEVGLVGHRQEDMHLDYKPLMEDELLLATPPGLFQTHQTEKSLDEFLQFTFLARENGSATRLLVEEALGEKGLRINDFASVVYINSLEGIKQAVRAGLGVSLLSRCSIEDYLRMGFLNGYTVPDLSLKRRFWLVWHRNRVLSGVARSFLDFCRDSFDGRA